MDIPRCAPREPRGSPPAIYIEGSSHLDHYAGSGRSHMQSRFQSSLASSTPMPISNSRRLAEDDAPPPLPPPKYLPGLGQPAPTRHDRIPSIDSNASWDSTRQESEQDRPPYGRSDNDRGIGRSHRDEGYHSLNSTISSLGSQDSLPKKLFMSHDQYQFNRPNSNDYDSSLIKKLDSRRTFDNRTPPRRSALSASVSNLTAHEQRLHTQLTPLSLPIRQSNKLLIDSPGRYTDTPPQSALSPRGPSFYGASSSEYRSPIEPMDLDRSPFARTRRNNSGSLPDDATISTHSSYDNADDNDFAMEDRSQTEDYMLRSEHQAIGQKRRASSPPGDDVPMQGMSGLCDPLRRREGASRASPTPRLAGIPPGSIPSVPSTTRSGSFASNASLTTNLSSINSFTGRSPGGLSSGGLSPVDVISNSPYNMPNSLGHSPRASLARVPHQRNLSSETRRLASPRKVSEVSKTGISKIPGGFFMCECCPKKPKKFETAEELSTHEAEKQYECSFCGNRFKNKNEAERHQNSLHVRRHSWSCSALLLSRYDRAFHESTNRPGEADTCGYCGEEFERHGGVGRPRQPTEQDWDERLKHLQEVHKFRECNSSKKFYRADHFRQHLKHSHAGTSGKWTNMLENACMLDEEPPQPSR
ncbi:hypothetical protein F5Y00DRAFT_63160 [Daldinia vernicosa]|uniref:uncharacterized protein n=1 Tax=Daldinia vernicosa TaxID=114800 RepID=UPI0020089602|nr:uncharacterized protein F5Y00DRAFT_63160 [Daldinia vernicosa]KAI0853947.1 hypothetical protein F5Y00DRAFT_63160 [Daldinia vernicosa]